MVESNSVALVVTSPPYFAGKEYEEILGVTACPRPTSSTSSCCATSSPNANAYSSLAAVLRSTWRTSAGGPTDRCRRCHRDPAEPRPPPAGRGHLVEGQGGRRFMRVGYVSAPVQSGVARRHRAHRDRQQGTIRPRAEARASGRSRAALDGNDLARRVRRGHHRPVGDRRPRARPGRSSGTVPRRAARAVDRALHLRRRRCARSVHGVGHAAVAALRTRRHYIGFDTEQSYVDRAHVRIAAEPSTPAAPRIFGDGAFPCATAGCLVGGRRRGFPGAELSVRDGRQRTLRESFSRAAGSSAFGGT